MRARYFIILLALAPAACKNNDSTPKLTAGLKIIPVPPGRRNPYADISKIPVPEGYERVKSATGSFAAWLRSIPLKEDKTVYLYNGHIKNNQTAQFAVLNIPVGNKDLQQCADAVMRLRANYLFDKGSFEEIIFYDNDRKPYRFSSPYTREHLDRYMEQVFGMCGTASLSKQLIKKDYRDISPGDVLIRGGFPGHAAMVMDVVINKDGDKKYMLSQSYMPAQDIHILVNPLYEQPFPWYDVEDDVIETPEYLFYNFELKSW